MTTDAHPANILVPRVLWAQRSDVVYLTIEVFDVHDEKIQLDANRLSFSGVRGSDNARFAVELEFYAPINPEASKKAVTGRNVSFVLEKVEMEEKFWPRLVSTPAKLHYIHTDFSKWVDEDEENEKPQANMQDYSNFDFSSFGGDGDMAGFGQADDSDADEEEEKAVEEEEHVHGENCKH